MAEYRIQWQIGGEARLSISDEATQDEVATTVERALEGIAEDVADDLASDLDAGTISYSHGGPVATIDRL